MALGQNLQLSFRLGLGLPDRGPSQQEARRFLLNQVVKKQQQFLLFKSAIPCKIRVFYVGMASAILLLGCALFSVLGGEPQLRRGSGGD